MSQRLERAIALHHKFLARYGITPSNKSRSQLRGIPFPDPYYERRGAPCSNSTEPGIGAVRSILSATALASEDASTRREILHKAASTAPMFNKGAYQYVTPGTNPAEIARKL